MGAPIPPDQADAAMRAVGWIPQEPYPGALSPWRCVCSECGSEHLARYSHIKERGRACPTCSKARTSTRYLERERPRAEADMKAAGFSPLDPYPGAHKPWRSLHRQCGEVVAPRLVQVRMAGRGCPVCSGGVALDPEDAARFMRSRDLEPLEPYPGGNRPWSCRCNRCGTVGSPAYSTVRAGGSGCIPCGRQQSATSRRAGFAAQAEADMRAAGLEPLEPYRTSISRWKCRHVPCGRIVYPIHHMVSLGHVCRQCTGNPVVEADEAVSRLATFGLEPLEPYPGHTRALWRVRCVGCGAAARKRLSSGKGCRRCRPFGADHRLPALVYVLNHTKFAAVKVGITNTGTTREADFRRAGWTVHRTRRFDFGADAYDVEQAVLNRLRNKLGIPAFLTADQMKTTGGATETANADLISAAALWLLVQEEGDRIDGENFPGRSMEQLELPGLTTGQTTGTGSRAALDPA